MRGCDVKEKEKLGNTMSKIKGSEKGRKRKESIEKRKHIGSPCERQEGEGKEREKPICLFHAYLSYFIILYNDMTNI